METSQSDTIQVQQEQQTIQESVNQLHQTTHGLTNVSKEIILIEKVAALPELYDSKHKNYRVSAEKDKKWTQISDSVGLTETQCKVKWKALRDQYWRELKRSDYTSIKWKYFKEMDFLRPYAPVKQMVHVSENIPDSKNIITLPKEIILISLVSQEPALYNPKHELYRHAVQKDQKWIQIADSVGWSESQCKAKWKALRDQYCREIKRSKFSPKANIKWKYFRELDFLRPFALARSYRPRNLHQSSSIKIEYANNNDESSSYSPCEFPPTQIKIEDQFSQQANQLTVINHPHQLQPDERNDWNYVAVNSIDGNQHSTADDVLTSFVQQISQQNSDASDAADNIHHHQQQQQQQQQQNGTTIHLQQHHPEEEDDDPIHTFLNIESYFEKELITMIQAEDVLYNSCHPNYRNTKVKLEVWEEIARKLKKSIKQCRLKWKALRDQYIREHKRLKSRENAESLPRWKHYDALNFLQKFIRHKSGDFETSAITVAKTEIDIDVDVDEHMTSSLPSPAAPSQMHSSLASAEQLNGVMHQTIDSNSQQQQQSVIDCTSTDDCDQAMDISDYIIGDEDEVHSTRKFSTYHTVDEEDLHESTSTSKEKCSNQGSSQSIQQQQIDDSHEFIESQSVHLQQQDQPQQQHDLQLLTNSAASHIAGTPTTGGDDSSATFSMTSHLADDDEIGAFFRAVAMKIRNAKMTPIAFTDLQIDILRVINGALKNH